MVRAERAGATRTYARSALARHTRGARRLDTAEQANQHNRSNADAASRCRRLPKCAWIAQQHKHPRSQRAPSDIALTEPDRRQPVGGQTCKMVPIAEAVAPADVRARPDDQARERRTEAQITGGELTADTCWSCGRCSSTAADRAPRAERAAGKHARSAPLGRRGALPLETGPVGGPSGS